MRTTVDFPDALFRRLQAEAVRRGLTPQAFISTVVERELSRLPGAKLPVIRSWKGSKLDLSGFDFDDLLG